MFAETDGASDRARGDALAHAAEALLAEAQVDTIDPAQAVQMAVAGAVLALYWETRHQNSAGRPAARVNPPRWNRPPVPATEPGA
jgi:hypothetical protein